MNDLQIIKSANFGDIQCDIYGDGNDFYMTREQIGTALEYSEPRVAIAKLHKTYEGRLNLPQFSTVTELVTVDGKRRKVTVSSRKGIMEICRHSEQPKADVFMDWTWDIMDGLIVGELEIIPRPAKRKKPVDLAFKQNMNIAKTLSECTGIKIGIAYAVAISRAEEQSGEDLAAYKILLPPIEEDHEIGTMNATDLGLKVGLNAVSTNKLLDKLGLQYKDDKKKWRLTEAGKEYGEEFPFDRNGHSDYRILWKESIVEFLKNDSISA